MRTKKHILFSIQNDTDNELLDIEKIWTPYYVGEKSRNKKLSGRGLGLSIMKKICETQGYLIDCSFENNKIEFKVLFPFLSNYCNTTNTDQLL